LMPLHAERFPRQNPRAGGKGCPAGENRILKACKPVSYIRWCPGTMNGMW
jgi:hypothetical protein